MWRKRPSSVDADVPGVGALLEEMAQCEEVPMIPNTPIELHEDPHFRPEHKVDLSSLASHSDQDEFL